MHKLTGAAVKSRSAHHIPLSTSSLCRWKSAEEKAGRARVPLPPPHPLSATILLLMGPAPSLDKPKPTRLFSKPEVSLRVITACAQTSVS